MSWSELTLNPRAILGYYETAPSLSGVAVHRVSLLRDGPTAEIVFEPTEFPQKPSPRWPVGANRCQIVIRAIGLSWVEVKRWGTGVIGDLEVAPAQGGMEVSFSGEGEFRFLCSHVDVISVSGYVCKRG